MTEKDIRRVQVLAESALKRQEAVKVFLERSNGEMGITPRITMRVDNIFEVQDALGGEIVYEPWRVAKDYFTATLTVNEVEYVAPGLTQKMIDERKGLWETLG